MARLLPPSPLRRRELLAGAVALAGAATVPAVALGDPMTTVALKLYDVTIRVFDPSRGLASGTDYVLPVRSPDPEHAAASTLANAASFTTKTDGTTALPVAFACVRVELRG